MKKVACLIAFVAGSCVGSAATWIFAKKKYEKIIQVEVDSAREVYNRMAKDLANKNNSEKEKIDLNLKDEKESNKDPYTEAVDSIEDADDDTIVVNDISELANDEIVLEQVTNENSFNEPYLIQENEYGELDGYNYDSLTYYSGDGIVTDSKENIIDNVDEIIGLKNLQEFGYVKADPYVIYVRNDQKRCDYEVLLDDRKYTEAYN